jgi:hypothetical protein
MRDPDNECEDQPQPQNVSSKSEPSEQYEQHQCNDEQHGDLLSSGPV